MRVLFCSTPGEGHVRPLLPLALAARGHEIALATGAGWAPQLEELGFAVLPAGADHDSARRFVRPEELRAAPRRTCACSSVRPHPRKPRPRSRST